MSKHEPWAWTPSDFLYYVKKSPYEVYLQNRKKNVFQLCLKHTKKAPLTNKLYSVSKIR